MKPRLLIATVFSCISKDVPVAMILVHGLEGHDLLTAFGFSVDPLCCSCCPGDNTIHVAHDVPGDNHSSGIVLHQGQVANLRLTGKYVKLFLVLPRDKETTKPVKGVNQVKCLLHYFTFPKTLWLPMKGSAIVQTLLGASLSLSISVVVLFRTLSISVIYSDCKYENVKQQYIQHLQYMQE